MSFRYKYGDKVWLLPYEEAPDHNWIEKRAWERIRARGIQTVAGFLYRELLLMNHLFQLRLVIFYDSQPRRMHPLRK